MKKISLILLPLLTLLFLQATQTAAQPKEEEAWIRINQLGYLPNAVKTAVWCSKNDQKITGWQLIDSATGITMLSGKPGKAFGQYGPFSATYRLDFSAFTRPGKYYLKAGNATSPLIIIGNDVYKGSADFALRYMRQQRSGFNPFLKDSCHNQDGYSLYGSAAGLPDSTFVDVSGGWHDASDYLQYSTTSANATYNLMLAYRDFPGVFEDQYAANGLAGSNQVPDIADEANWGLQWLLKMFPSPDKMFNQIADDRDHISMRMPALDSQYGRGYQRPVYFVSGQPQQRGKFMNSSTGTSSTAGKFASAFAMAYSLKLTDNYKLFYSKAMDALAYANKQPGYSQTASVKSPYIYAEENWVDDMELAYAGIHNMLLQNDASAGHGHYLWNAVAYAKKEKVTPWLGADTAAHYQWYPFVNAGHYELLKQIKKGKGFPQSAAGYTSDLVKNFAANEDSLAQFYRQGILQVWEKAKSNAFYRGVPFIWCSNNLTVAFAQQCYWYRSETGDAGFAALEQANIDWLLGCNPWGTSMIYGLPSWGDTPADPHSAFTHLKNYPVDGGLVDGPVYGSIYNNLIGIQLYAPDEYAAYQSKLAVYHDDYGDYSSNEPTMDGTASLVYLLAAQEAQGLKATQNATQKINATHQTKKYGAIIRGDSTSKKMAIVFTADEFGDGSETIISALQKEKVKASFFLTGRFYHNREFANSIASLQKNGHYLGAHSNDHLLYNDWQKRDSLLVNYQQFAGDLAENYKRMQEKGIEKKQAGYFLPPYEWYNDSIAAWTAKQGLQLVNYSPGTISAADYTWPALKNYRSSESILQSIKNFETASPSGLNGFILLLHLGTDPARTDKFYAHLPVLLQWLKQKGYKPVRIDELLGR